MARPAEERPAGALTTALLGAVEGIVNLTYVFAVGSLVGAVPAAIAVSGVLGLFWLILGMRLWALGGLPGLMLALLLGAPILLRLPLLDPQLLGTAWPATLAAWLVAIAVSLVFVVARRPLQAAGQSAFGPVLDRGLMGGQVAMGEEAGERRVAAFGGVVGALLDVGLLLAGYWLLGLPLIGTLERSTGQSWLGSAAIGVLLIAVTAIVWGRFRAAQKTIAETTGEAWARRTTVALALVLGLTIVTVGCFAAVPAVLAAPLAERFGAAGPVDHVVVNWEFWQPSTPSATEATYNVAFSCSNGESLGAFREVIRPQSASAMPAGAIGLTESGIDPNGTPCTSWQETYYRLRRAAGLPPQLSHSWNWVDARFVLGADGAAGVVERHWVTFTSGIHDRLDWSVSGDLQGMSDRLELRNGDVAIPLNPSGTRPSDYAETHVVAGRTTIVWHFPPVTAPNERSFTVQYRLPHAALTSGNRWRFSRDVLVPRTGTVWRTTAAIVFPNGTDLKTLQLASSDANANDNPNANANDNPNANAGALDNVNADGNADATDNANRNRIQGACDADPDQYLDGPN